MFTMLSLIVLEAKEYVSKLLAPLKAKGYVFHSLEHTLDVFERATYIARQEKISDDLIELIQLGALFHDTGFIYVYNGHEERSVIIFEEFIRQLDISRLAQKQKENAGLIEDFLSNWKIPQDKMDIIKYLILATIPLSEAHNKLEMILKDADLDNFGRDDFFERGKMLRQEAYNIKREKYTDDLRYKNTLAFVSKLGFHTTTQQRERGKKFEENKESLRNLCAI